MSDKAFSQELTRLVITATSVFRDYGSGDWVLSRGDGKWTRLQILGHLIDSAINNHQRFVRALAQDSLVWPGYDQDAMVAVQQFGAARPVLLVNLWESLNLYLARLISLIPDHKWETPCTIGTDPTTTLEALVESYIDHLRHHLQQIHSDPSASPNASMSDSSL